MNWLAHLLLAEASPASRVGCILPDMMSLPELNAMPELFQSEIQRHRRIDAFTDSHSIVRRSRERCGKEYRRFSGILVDVFYDHILACEWARFSSAKLPRFVQEVYAGFDECHAMVPGQVRVRLEKMKEENWLCSYQTLPGIALTLGRIGGRLRNQIDLAPAVQALEERYDAFQLDFTCFFPELVQNVAPDHFPLSSRSVSS